MTDDDLQLEHGFLKAPWEVLMRSFRSAHKAVLKDADAIAADTSKLVSDAKAASQNGAPLHIPPERVDDLISRVITLQRRLEAARDADRQGLDRCLARIEHLTRRTNPAFNAASRNLDSLPQSNHLKSQTPPRTNGKLHSRKPRIQEAPSVESKPVLSAEAVARWEKTRLDRVLVDYMLRSGLYASGARLAKSERIEALVDTAIFDEARKVIASLQARDCSTALAWCQQNKRRLSKAESTLEFHLHRQVFIEYARAGEKLRAIKYAQDWLSNASHQEDVGAFMGLLVFAPDTPCQPYKTMYSEHKWRELEEMFRNDNYKLHGLTPESTLEILLKTGLATLKTRKCGTEKDRKPNCPTCKEPYRTLALDLPHGQHVNSVLVCAISGDIMDENNPPMALPNGNVYGFKALQDMALRNDNQVLDPKTDTYFEWKLLRKCFIM